ncbi:hypothetical protein OSTOST_21941, partial [Ostertagia ostertagi]
SESYEQFASRDKDWLARINQTGWLQLINYCLSAAAEGIESLMDHGCSVIIYENNGLDISAVVSSLVQICCDRYYRTLEGLDSLISKEWIALGHPFAQRLFGVSGGSNDAVTAPTFSNIPRLCRSAHSALPNALPVNIYIYRFTYTQHALIALWDLALTGMVPAFSASSIADQLASNISGGPFPLERFFHESYFRLFTSITNIGAVIVEKASGSGHFNLWCGFDAGDEGLFFIPAVPRFACDPCKTGNALIYDVLRPPRTMADVQLWNECYLRWIPSANVTRGGAVIDDFALKEVIEEEFPSSINVLSRFGATNVNLDKVSSAHPYSAADVNHRGYFASRDSDTLSISSMSLSVSEDRWKVSSYYLKPAMFQATS